MLLFCLISILIYVNAQVRVHARIMGRCEGVSCREMFAIGHLGSLALKGTLEGCPMWADLGRSLCAELVWGVFVPGRSRRLGRCSGPWTAPVLLRSRADIRSAQLIFPPPVSLKLQLYLHLCVSRILI